MPGDPIFGDPNDDELANGGERSISLTETQWKELEDERKDLKSTVASLSTKLEDTNKLLANPPTPAPALPVPTNPVNMSADESLTLFAKDPGSYTAMVADGRISKAINEQLAPLLSPIIATTHQGILQSHRSAFDQTYGAGKFDEIIMPTLQTDLDSLVAQNSNAVGDSNTVRALIERIEGTKRVELNEAEAGVSETREKADAEGMARIVATLPMSMRPKPEGGTTELSAEALEMFDSIEQATGERPNTSVYLATENAKPGVSGFVNAMTELNNANSSGGK